MKSRVLTHIAIWLAAAFGTHCACACTVSENFLAVVPMNEVDMDNASRVRLADTVIRAKNRPAVEIMAETSTPAFGSERNPKALAQTRADSVKSFLVMLGIKDTNIYSRSSVFYKPIAPDKESLEELRSIAVD